MATQFSLDVERLQAALAHWLAHETQRGVFITDSQFRLVLWNQWMEVHSGRLAGDVKGRSLFELYPEAATRGIRATRISGRSGHLTSRSWSCFDRARRGCSRAPFPPRWGASSTRRSAWTP